MSDSWKYQPVDKIIADIEDRAGLGDEWDQIDDEIKDEIRERWAQWVHDLI
jgi:hypothetical protein